MLLSALDQSPVFADETPAEALDNTLAVARACEGMGLHRYWVAEHHGSDSFAGCAPEILLMRLAGETSTMRLGSGGVMLTHYSPYKVAETFRTLGGLGGDRFDLGIGRAPGGDPWQAGALAYGSRTTTADFFPDKVLDLMAWLDDRRPNTRAFRRVKVTPGLGPSPAVHLLASSSDSALLAAHHRLPLALAHFITPDCLDLARLYRQHFGGPLRTMQGEQTPPTEDLGQKPWVTLALFAICAETEEEAVRLSAPANLWRRSMRMARFPSFARTQDAVEQLAELRGQDGGGEQALDEREAANRRLVGTPQVVRERLRELVEQTGADEVMAVTICEPLQARVRSYELLQEAVQGL